MTTSETDGRRTAAAARRRAREKDIIAATRALFDERGPNLSFAAELAAAVGRDRIIAAVDSRGGQVVIHGWRTRLAIGPVEAVSVYRNETLNVCAGGAKESAHRWLYALDMVPLRPTTRPALMRGLCAIHAWQGGGSAVGLGFYKGLRFHIDSKKYRKWGAALGDETEIGCPQVMAQIAAEAAAAKAAIAARKTPVQGTPAPIEPTSITTSP